MRGAPRRARSVPVLYGAISLVLVAGALTFALSSPPPATPPLAEVAPAPQENIEVERVEQSSRFGDGAGGEEGCVPGDPGCAGTAEQATPASSTSTASPDPADDDRLASGQTWDCVPGPGGPRQTEDPQSPPCTLEKFVGNNGGATSTGVTSTEIFVAIPAGLRTTEFQRYNLTPLVRHVNRYYELYGRRIVLVEPDASGDEHDPAAQRAAAEQVADAKVFASFNYPRYGAFQRTLAERGVITFVDGKWHGLVPESELAGLHPYVWSVYPSLEDSLLASASVLCGLAGRPAAHGGSDVAQRTRRFGLISEVSASNIDQDATLLIDRLRSCGGEPITATFEASVTDVHQMLQKLRDAGVTTLVCVCIAFHQELTEAAEDLLFRPEWFVPGTDESMLFLRYRRQSGDEHPREQLAHAFGLTGRLRRPVVDATQGRDHREEQFWFHAAKRDDPTFTCRVGSGNGCHHTSTVSYGFYAQLLILASGIQAAGPNLTPETFAAGLASLRYPNPGVGQAPWWQPSVGFGPGDHSFNSDVALFWWRDPDDAGYQARTDFGEMCYLGDGRRYTLDTFPPDADELFFDLGAGCR